MGDRQAFPRGVFGAEDELGAVLTAGCRLVLSALWSYARWWEPGDPWVFPSVDTLAQVTRQHPRSVKRQIAMLTDASLIRRHARRVGGAKILGWVLARPVTEESPNNAAQVMLDIDPGDGSVTPVVTGQLPMGDPSVTLGVVDESPISTTEAPDQAPPEDPVYPPAKPAGDEALILGVLEYLGAAVVDLTEGRKRGPRDGPTNRRMIRLATKQQRATLDDWKQVIDAQLESVRPKPEYWHCLSLSTIHRPKNWARLRDAPRAPRGRVRRAPHAPSSFDRPTAPSPTPPIDPDEIEDFPL